MAEMKKKMRASLRGHEQDELYTLWRTRDYEGILCQPLTHMCAVAVSGKPFSDIAIAVAGEYSESLVAAHPISMLRIACALAAADEGYAFVKLPESP